MQTLTDTDAQLRQPWRRAASSLADFGLSVAECMLLPPMNQGVVVSGRAGLTRRLSWVHVVDHSDVESSLAGSELLLTSGVTLAQDHELQRDIFGIMERQRSAGLVIAVGRYMRHIPQEMIARSDAAGIPIIGMPWEVNFGDITRELLTRLVQSHYRFLERAERLNRDLLEVLVRRGDLQAVCDRLAEDLERPAAVTDEAFKILAVSRPARGRIFSDWIEPEQARRIMTRAILRAAGKELSARPLLLDDREVGLAVPIVTASRTRGWLLLDSSAAPFHRFDLMTTEIAATAAALVMTYGDDLLQALQRRADHALIETLEGHLPITAEIAAAMGLSVNAPSTLALVDIEAGDAEAACAAARKHLQKLFGASIAVARNRSLLVVAQQPRGRQKDWTAGFAAALAAQGFAPRVAVSRPLENFRAAPKAYADTREALTLGRLLRPTAPVVKAEHAVALARVLRDLRASADPMELCPMIARLEEYDRSLHGSLIEALERYLDADGNVSLAARQLAIHRHTLLYRLNRISEILGLDLDSATRLELRLQLMAWRFSKS